MRALLAAAALALAPVTAPAEPPVLSHRDLKPYDGPAADARVRYGTEPSQFADLWLPDGPGPHPVVVLVHGGCWQAAIADLTIMDAAADDLRRRGWAVWNIEYRRVGEPGGGYPGTYADVAAAFDALREQAPAHALDLRRLVAAGHSAGGHLALWASARPALPNWSDLRRGDPLPVPAVLSLGGVGDLADAAADPTFSGACGKRVFAELIGPRRDPYAETSPSRMPAPAVRQVMLHGAREQIAPVRLGHAYAAQALAQGRAVRVVEVEGAGHFEVVTPGAAAWEVVAETLHALAVDSEASL